MRFIESIERYLTKSEIAKIACAKIGIAGAGGLGSNLAMMLARTGFRNLKIADFDTVDPSNLNRQFYFQRDIGKKKVDALKDNLLLINPDITVETFSQKLVESNIRDVFEDCDIVAEAFDKAECKKMLLDSFLKSQKYIISVSGIAGYGNSDEIKARKLKDNLFLIGDLTSDVSKYPPLAPKVMIAAAKQADTILEIVLKKAS